MRVSIDYDNCLTQPKVQELAKKLIARGHDVFILTSRFDSVRRLKFPDLKSNEDLYRIAEEVGIKPYKIAFTNQQKKWIWLLETSIKIHIDDDKTVLKDLAYYGLVQGFDCNREDLSEAVWRYIEDLENF
ncbi:hypothetical protein [Epilithonimonas sp.]|uniref:hypothetical protein n=1 Tax=Epilithonimonas sp. TaxID=2894511 RepID=UPI0035B1213C